jgi:TctA family transporter
MIRGTLTGALCALIPGTGPTIASFVAYAGEKKLSRWRHELGSGAIEGVAGPEAATHTSVQADFIPTMSLGIPGDTVMALMLGALIIQGIQPGPQLVAEHPDIFWGLIASFWIGNIMLVVLNVPLIGLWVKLLTIPYRVLYPCALFFICIGVYSATNDVVPVLEALILGVIGYVLLQLDFHAAPVMLGFVLGPRFEENFRRAMLISHGDIYVFVERPISAAFLAVAFILVAVQVVLFLRRSGMPAASVLTVTE